MPALPLAIAEGPGDGPLAVPARGSGEPPGVAGLGVLTGEIGPELVDRVIEMAGCREKRRRLLPARTVVYFVLGLCLFSGADSMGPPGYRSVMRWLTNGLRDLPGMVLPTSSALTRARQWLGQRPFELLFGLCRGPLAAPGTPGAFAFGLRLVAWDGTGLDAAATPANAAAFGVTQGGDPQLRLVALKEIRSGSTPACRAASDERDEVGCVDGAPAFLGGLDQLECHGDPGGPGAGPLGDLGPVPDRGEGQLDGVGPSINAVA